MIEGWVDGKLYSLVQRISGTGNLYVVAKVQSLLSNGEMLMVSAAAFDKEPQEALLALEEGEMVSLFGRLTPKAWIDAKTGAARPGMDLVVTQVLEYHAKRKRDAMAAAGEQPQQPPRQKPPSPAPASVYDLLLEDEAELEFEKWKASPLDEAAWQAALLQMPDWSDVPLAEECC